MGVGAVTLKIALKVCLVLHFLFQDTNSVCVIDLQNVGIGKLPLLLQGSNSDADLEGSSLLLPTVTSRLVSLRSDDEVSVLCAGKDNRFKVSGEVRQVNKIDAECVSGMSFQLGEITYSLQDIECTEDHVPSIKVAGTCWEGNKRLQIGYKFPVDKFLRLIDVCFDENSYKTVYVNYTLVEGIERRHNKNQPRNVIDKVDYFNDLPSSSSSYYSCSNQLTKMTSILGSSALGGRYIACSKSSGNYLVKNYLAPSSDFVYEAEQVSSHYYINTVPMWHSIKNGNWKNLEEEIRLYAANMSRSSSNLIIYTGTLGITTLPDQRAREKQLYLGTKDNTNVIPVPQWIWKLVYEPTVKEGIVFILVNNPYRKRFAACTCVCPQTKWTLSWNRQDTKKGYVYCCTISNFKRVFSGLPDLEVTGLLTKNRPYDPLNLDVIPR